MIFYTPYKDRAKNSTNKKLEEHYAVAAIAFTSNLAFNIMIAYLLFYRLNLKKYFFLLIFAQIGFFGSLVFDVEYYKYLKDKNPDTQYKNNYFPVAENINFLFIVVSIVLISYVYTDRQSVMFKSEQKIRKMI